MQANLQGDVGVEGPPPGEEATGAGVTKQGQSATQQSRGSDPCVQDSARIKGRRCLEREKERLETLIGDLEVQLQTLHARAIQPGLHHREYAQIAEEQQSLEARLSQAFEQWAEVSGQLERQ